LEQVVRLGTLETNWWTIRDMVGRKLRMNPNALYYAVRLLVEEGDAESNALDLYAVRATLRGWIKITQEDYKNNQSTQDIVRIRASA